MAAKKKTSAKLDSQRRRVARVKPLGETHIKRSMINNGMSLGLLNSSRTFVVSDVPAMLEDDQISLGMEYLKIPIAQAPIAVKSSIPSAYAWTADLYQRIWNALIPKLDLALAYGENAYEPMYRKDKKNPAWWDFADDFDVAPPMASIPWTKGEKIAFVAVHESFGVGNLGYYWFETGDVPEGASILEGAGVYRPSKVLWVVNDCLTSRWYGRSVLRAAHLRWKGKNMPDGCLENLLKASFKSAFSGTVLRYPAGESVVMSDGSIKTSEEYADFLLQVIKTGSGIRFPDKMKDSVGWGIEDYAKNLVDPEKVQAPLDYLDRGMLRGMGIPDEILTHDGSTGGYSRSLVSVDAFYSRGETRAQTILPQITESIVNPLGRQRYGMEYEASAQIMRQARPDDENTEDANGNGVPDALEGSMKHDQGDQEQDGGDPQQQAKQTRFSNLARSFDREVNRASTDALSMSCIAAGIAIHAKDTGRFLLLQRAHFENDEAAGSWEFPGGHIEHGESEFEAAVREWQEETGNEFPKGKRIGKWKAKNGKYMGFIYSIPKESAVDIHQGKDRAIMNPDDPDGDKIEVAAWFEPAHMKDNPAIREELQADIPAILGKVGNTAFSATGHWTNQPRIPAGKPEGGEWTEESGGKSANILDVNTAEARGDASPKGETKMTNSGSNPKVNPKQTYYHGTSRDFKNFDDTKGGGWISFTPQEWHAGNFGDKVIETKLSVKNPLDLTDFDKESDAFVDGDKLYQYLTSLGFNLDHSKFKGKLESINDALTPLRSEIKSQAIKLGYDGIVRNDYKDGQSADEVVVFSPSQVKIQKPKVNPGKQKTREAVNAIDGWQSLPPSKRWGVENMIDEMSKADKEVDDHIVSSAQWIMNEYKAKKAGA